MEIHTSVYIILYAIPEAWDMCIGSEKGWGGALGGHEGNRAVTLSHDAGQRLKLMGQDGGLVCF